MLANLARVAAGGRNGEKQINMGEIYEAEVTGPSNLLEVGRVREKGIREDSLISSLDASKDDSGSP